MFFCSQKRAPNTLAQECASNLCRPFTFLSGCSGLAELILGRAADGADEIIGQVFKGGAGGDAVVGVADGGVISPTAEVAYVFIHRA